MSVSDGAADAEDECGVGYAIVGARQRVPGVGNTDTSVRSDFPPILDRGSGLIRVRMPQNGQKPDIRSAKANPSGPGIRNTQPSGAVARPMVGAVSQFARG